jgi:hypothetical protein
VLAVIDLGWVKAAAVVLYQQMDIIPTAPKANRNQARVGMPNCICQSFTHDLIRKKLSGGRTTDIVSAEFNTSASMRRNIPH